MDYVHVVLSDDVAGGLPLRASDQCRPEPAWAGRGALGASAVILGDTAPRACREYGISGERIALGADPLLAANRRGRPLFHAFLDRSPYAAVVQ